MRLGVMYDPDVCPYYRAVDPMLAMERRGHEVVWPDASGALDFRALASCDAVHVYRLAGADKEGAIKQLARSGTSIVYDNDDNRAALMAAEAPRDRRAALEGQRVHASTVKIARGARTFTTTTEALADVYRRAGVPRVEVIDNALSPDLPRARSRHKGVVVGWIAGAAHQRDADGMGIADPIRRVVSKHPDVHVECVGVDLRLADRYRHDPWLAFEALPRRIGGFDIGIAPLADTPANAARSDIKLKEYAASGVPWLASPVGPYAALGEREGGRLVADDGWFDALSELVTKHRDRRRLARKAKKWAKGHFIERTAAQWERVFVEAAREAHDRPGA